MSGARLASPLRPTVTRIYHVNPMGPDQRSGGGPIPFDPLRQNQTTRRCPRFKLPLQPCEPFFREPLVT